MCKDSGTPSRNKGEISPLAFSRFFADFCGFFSVIQPAQMATEDTALARAVITLVTGFHEAANNRPSMSIPQFKTLVSKQIPDGAKMVEDEQSLRQLLQEMGVKNGQNISFENFWEFIKYLAIKESIKVRQDKDTCVLL